MQTVAFMLSNVKVKPLKSIVHSTILEIFAKKLTELITTFQYKRIQSSLILPFLSCDSQAFAVLAWFPYQISMIATV